MPLRLLITAALAALLAACNAPPVAAPAATPAPSAAPAENVLPPEAIHVLPEAVGWDTAALEDYLAYMQAQGTTGLLILQRGLTIAEHNWPTGEADAAFRENFVHGASSDGALLEDVASLQKSIIALLAAIAADKGLLDVSCPVSDYLGPGWSNAAPEEETAITVRHLLEMNSGLTDDLRFEAPAGTRFFYNTPAYAKLQAVLQAASGEALPVITEAWLTSPLGLDDTGWRPRPAAFGNVGNPLALVTTPRDLARIGQLVLDGGAGPDGTQVISRTELARLFAPTSTNPAYGRLWWLNGGAWSVAAGGQRRDGAFIPAAPADTIAGLGFLGRQIFIVPSKGLVIVRTGANPPDTDFMQKSWDLIAEALPD